jgi:hypothetical protein
MNLAAQTIDGGGVVGRLELNDALQEPFYIVPSEKSQRPRLVTQMLLQNVQALHVGTFPLPGEIVVDQLVAPPAGTQVTPTPGPQNQNQSVTTVVRPDIITLMVPAQDAVTLTWLVFSGAQITLTLRNPNDQVVGALPDTASLEYLMTQYNIPLPAKLPYAIQSSSLQSGKTTLDQPLLDNDKPQPK